ncbi:MAG: alanine--tRNA ligase [Caldisphaeraceae archaeon]|nr:alanine--tRNA ligase [Caldisphaeraceae archaeon]
MPKLNPEDYRLSFFKERGFVRKKCKVGGEYFWSLNQNFDTCQDAPDTEYWFDKIPSIKGLSVREAREKFIEFFKKNGHTPLNPRPVVARWREDLYLTIASIVDFQPHVTSGLVKPPANPLVISQPSIRLEDIDNVGLTIGRHLTTFEMGAHHAFNYPETRIYWKEETVKYAFDFFTKELKIPEDMIVFKESWWEGGGNAGPCFEVAVGGLELATLVFMMYKIDNKGYTSLPLKIVDTGYGIERIAWFTQKTPTAFDAIFGEVIDKYRKILNLNKPPSEVLWGAFKAAGRLDPEDITSVEEFYGSVSKNTGLSIEMVKGILQREAHLYVLLDHIKTISLMLGDGIVPSNTGEGYLARLVIRRALKHLKLLNKDISLVELTEPQIALWGRDFPQIYEAKDYIVEVIKEEERKFKEALERGLRLSYKMFKSGSINNEELIKLYDSHGIPPEIIAEEASKKGIKLNVPNNFYSLIASRHKGPSKVRGTYEKVQLPKEVIEWMKKFPETRLYFHEKPYEIDFKARLLGTMGKYVILDSTLFYPTGGGQAHDIGRIKICNEYYNVIDVQKANGVVVHVVDKEISKPCDEVSGEINWKRRYRLMRHHSATHLLMGSIRRVLGKHIWQAGAEKTPEKGRLDVTHYKMPSIEEIRQIERLANNVIDERKPINQFYMDRTEAENRYGFSLYQGGVPTTPTIRVVEIKDWDTEACFGTHLRNTGEIGGIKITNVEKIQDGVIRFEFVAGTRLSEELEKIENKIQEINNILGTKKGEEVQRINSIMQLCKEKENALQAYRKLWENQVEAIVSRAERIDNGIRLAVLKTPDSDTRYIRELLKRITEKNKDMIIGFVIESENRNLAEFSAGSLASEKINLGELLKKMSRKLKGSGGGKKSYGSMSIDKEFGIDAIKNVLKECLA